MNNQQIQDLTDARNHFAAAQAALISAGRALLRSGLPMDDTMKELKETIGDVALSVATITDELAKPSGA